MASSYLTARKRAENLGAAREGTEHHWNMTVSSVALLILTPVFVFTLGPVIGGTHAEVVAALARPWTAIVVALMLLVSLLHFRHGAQVVAEDYAHGLARKALVVGVVFLSYALIAVGLFAVARIAL